MEGRGRGHGYAWPRHGTVRGRHREWARGAPKGRKCASPTQEDPIKGAHSPSGRREVATLRERMVWPREPPRVADSSRQCWNIVRCREVCGWRLDGWGMDNCCKSDRLSAHGCWRWWWNHGPLEFWVGVVTFGFEREDRRHRLKRKYRSRDDLG
jgi:hypothetical protein